MPVSDTWALATSELAAWELLAAYREGSASLFASPSRTVLATGNQLGADATFPAKRLDVELSRLMRDYGVSTVLAAVPYDPDGEAWVVVPEHVEHGGPLDAVAETPVDGADTDRRAAWRITARPSRADYAASVSAAVARITDGHLSKVVLARSLHLVGGQVDADAILRRLARRDPHGYTYAIDLPATSTGGWRRLVGASPELLVARYGDRVVARPLAGSAARSSDHVEDARRGAALLASTKDLAEHAFVVDEVVASLTPFCRDLVVPTRSALVRTATMWHLLTEVSGELIDPSTTSLTLALAMHPTPAVGGTPTAEAHETIAELEGFDRGFYAGAVGWCNADGDGEWAITLRCAELREDSITLYAGAGIVAGSDPESEVAETGAKFRTMLDAMGIDFDA